MLNFDTDIVRYATHLTSNDNKLLLLNGHYYCELTASQKSREVPKNYIFFSGYWKEDCCNTLTQYTDCYVLDVNLEKGHHKRQFGKLYHFVHKDMSDMDSFSIMLCDDNALVNVVSIEVVEKPYPLKCLIDLLDNNCCTCICEHESNDYDPMLSLDGALSIDAAHIGRKSVTLEYDIGGKLYAEIVDFTDVKDGEIVHLNDTTRREVLVNMFADGSVLSKDNVQQIADIINTRTNATKKEYEDGKDR